MQAVPLLGHGRCALRLDSDVRVSTASWRYWSWAHRMRAWIRAYTTPCYCSPEPRVGGSVRSQSARRSLDHAIARNDLVTCPHCISKASGRRHCRSALRASFASGDDCGGSPSGDARAGGPVGTIRNMREPIAPPPRVSIGAPVYNGEHLLPKRSICCSRRPRSCCATTRRPIARRQSAAPTPTAALASATSAAMTTAAPPSTTVAPSS